MPLALAASSSIRDFGTARDDERGGRGRRACGTSGSALEISSAARSKACYLRAILRKVEAIDALIDAAFAIEDETGMCASGIARRSVGTRFDRSQAIGQRALTTETSGLRESGTQRCDDLVQPVSSSRSLDPQGCAPLNDPCRTRRCPVPRVRPVRSAGSTSARISVSSTTGTHARAASSRSRRPVFARCRSRTRLRSSCSSIVSAPVVSAGSCSEVPEPARSIPPPCRRGQTEAFSAHGLERVTLQQCRHGYRSFLDDIEDISEVRADRYQGHSSTHVRRRYIHELDGQIAKDAERIEKYLTGSTGASTGASAIEKEPESSPLSHS